MKDSGSFLIFFSCTACTISVPSPGTEAGPRQWKPTVLTTGPPRNSQGPLFRPSDLGLIFPGRGRSSLPVDCGLAELQSCRVCLRPGRGVPGVPASSFLPACPLEPDVPWRMWIRVSHISLSVSPSSAHVSPAPVYSPGIPSARASCLSVLQGRSGLLSLPVSSPRTCHGEGDTLAAPEGAGEAGLANREGLEGVIGPHRLRSAGS